MVLAKRPFYDQQKNTVANHSKRQTGFHFVLSCCTFSWVKQSCFLSDWAHRVLSYCEKMCLCFAYVLGFVYTWKWACQLSTWWCAAPQDLTHSNMLHGCVYKHPADTQTQRVSEHGNHQSETSLPYGWESWGCNVRCKFVFSVICSRDAVHGWSTEECYCVLNSKEPNSSCAHRNARAWTFIFVRTSHIPQMLINHYH